MSFFSDAIKNIRSLNKWTQEQTAIFFDVNRSTVGAWEEERAEPNIEKLCDMADRYKCTIDDLIGRTKQERKSISSIEVRYASASVNIKKVVDILLEL